MILRILNPMTKCYMIINQNRQEPVEHHVPELPYVIVQANSKKEAVIKGMRFKTYTIHQMSYLDWSLLLFNLLKSARKAL